MFKRGSNGAVILDMTRKDGKLTDYMITIRVKNRPNKPSEIIITLDQWMFLCNHRAVKSCDKVRVWPKSYMGIPFKLA
jgi:hypothetical protein